VPGVPCVPVSNYKRMRLWVLSCPSSTGGLGITGDNYSSAITWHTCHTSHTTNDHRLSGCASCVSVLRKKTEVTLDRSHVSKLLNEAVDQVRREEQNEQPELKRTRYRTLPS
jgi:hypothetical protein